MMNIKFATLAVLVLAQVCLATSPAWADSEAKSQSLDWIKHTALKNGMNIVFIPDYRSEGVTIQVCYRVGSSDEPIGRTGISHFLEHLMFWGTEDQPEDSYKKHIESIGGRHNAFTSNTYTAYYATVAKEHLEEIFELEADRMINLDFDEKSLDRERQVVLEERHLRINNNANADLYEQLKIVAFERSGYRNPIIGWDEDLQSISYAQVYDWYKRWYRPDNAVLIVVGNAQFPNITKLAKQTFGKIKKPKEDLVIERIQEPKQKAQRKVLLHRQDALEQITILWKIPSLDRHSPAPPLKTVIAFDVAEHLLSADYSSYLYQELVVRQKLATYVGASSSISSRQLGTFTIQAYPAEGVSLAQLEEAIFSALSAIDEKTFAAKTLTKAKNSIMAQFTYLRDSPKLQAYIVGGMELSGIGWPMLATYGEVLEQISLEGVQMVISEFLVRKSANIGYMQPPTQPPTAKN